MIIKGPHGSRDISRSTSPFVIAEMSGNHNQSLDRACEIVDSVASTGAHALKLQTYTADTLTIDYDKDDFFIDSKDSLWKGKSLYQLYKEAFTPWEWHKPIFDRCKEKGLICFSTPFDETAVDFLETLDVPAYKIASFENNHIPLIKKVASTGKPLIISTGMASLADLDNAVSVARKSGCNDIVLLKCTSTYPASPSDSNLATIPHMRELFSCEVGLSDHTLGIGVSIAGVALGASVIERHVTLSRKDGGVDSAFSLEPQELEYLVKEAEKAWIALGTVEYGPSKNETESFKYRRSIYIIKDMSKGDVFDNTNIKIIRPGYGLPPKYMDIIIGKKISKDVERGTPLRWDHIG